MADEFMFGWFTGLMTIILPYLLFTIFRLRRQLKRFNPVHDYHKEEKEKSPIWKTILKTLRLA